MTAVLTGMYTLGPSDGQLLVKVFREGVAARVGHDLVFEVKGWNAKVVVDAPDPSATTLEATADVGSFSIIDSSGGAKPLTRSDRSDIKRNIEEKILDTRRFPSIDFRSTAVATSGPSRATLAGDLTIAGTTRPVEMALSVAGDRVHGTMTVVQSQWGIKPFAALMGALRVRDAVDIVVDLRLPGRAA
jgi:polyisoprenoid-binding protein YceI